MDMFLQCSFMQRCVMQSANFKELLSPSYRCSTETVAFPDELIQSVGCNGTHIFNTVSGEHIA